MKRYVFISVVIAWALLCFVACSDDDGGSNEYHDWQQRNEAFFASKVAVANEAIRSAQREHGEAWKEYCQWQTFVSYRHDASLPPKQGDSIVVEVLERGKDGPSPFINDSVRVYFRGRLIPTESYPEGMVFSHSGQSSKYEDIFNTATAVPTTQRAFSFVTGLSTALLHMHIGDRWRIYVPADLGYSVVDHGSIPAYSTLIFEVQLLAFFRSGASVTPWN